MGRENRLGKISSIDYESGMVRVVYHEKDDAVTRLIPLLSDEYKMPTVGDQVLVIHLSNGTEAGVVLGRPWSEKNVPPENGKGLWRKDLGESYGEAFMKYKDGTLTIKAANVVIDGNLNVTGELTVTGDAVAAGISVQTHTHTDSTGGTTTAPN